VTRPKTLGGLGIKDLGAFNQALRLRWIWHRWATPSKSWTGLHIAMTGMEEALFMHHHKIGQWEQSEVLEGQLAQWASPRRHRARLYKLAWRKNQNVATALQRKRWMRGLQRMATDQELHQFVELWSQLQGIELQQQEDEVVWKQTSGQYSTKSAYNIQFTGSFSEMDWNNIWKIKAEHKCRFFIWFLL
jgi:hypothetical protein